MAVIAAYPGSFDPPTLAHVTLAEAAIRQAGINRVDLVLSRRPLGKEHRPAGPSVEQRLRVLREVAATRPWLGAVEVETRLVADIASGYDAVVMGADKWAQVVDPAWYGSPTARDEALRRLPRLLVAPRAGRHPEAVAAAAGLTVAVTALDIPLHLADVSSTRVRAGAHHLMLPEAAASGLWR